MYRLPWEWPYYVNLFNPCMFHDFYLLLHTEENKYVELMLPLISFFSPSFPWCNTMATSWLFILRQAGFWAWNSNTQQQQSAYQGICAPSGGALFPCEFGPVIPNAQGSSSPLNVSSSAVVSASFIRVFGESVCVFISLSLSLSTCSFSQAD